MESTLQEWPPRARRRGVFVARAVAAFLVLAVALAAFAFVRRARGAGARRGAPGE